MGRGAKEKGVSRADLVPFRTPSGPFFRPTITRTWTFACHLTRARFGLSLAKADTYIVLYACERLGTSFLLVENSLLEARKCQDRQDR